MSLERPQQTQIIETNDYPNSHTVEFRGGSVEYSLYGQPTLDHNPIIVVKGFVQGRVSNKEMAELMSKDGRQVLIYEDPKYEESISGKNKRDAKKALDFQAEAVLAAAEHAGFLGQGQPINLVAHSLGGLVAQRVRQIAGERSITSFNPDKGSKLALLATAGSNMRENILSLGSHFPKYMFKGKLEAKALDPTGAKGKITMKNAFNARNKTIGEIRALSTDRINYDKLGEALHVVYPEDKMFPWSKEKVTFSQNLRKELPVKLATPVNPEQTALKGLDLYLTKARLIGKKRLDFALSHRGAGHDDPTNNSLRTARTILEYFDGDIKLTAKFKTANEGIEDWLAERNKKREEEQRAKTLGTL